MDDILADVDKQEAEKLRKKLFKRFGMVQFEERGRLLYLGMQINVTDQQGATIVMVFYTKQLLKGEVVPEM
jgi:hypothetical protein